jgi:hypothetical protein
MYVVVYVYVIMKKDTTFFARVECARAIYLCGPRRRLYFGEGTGLDPNDFMSHVMNTKLIFEYSNCGVEKPPI